MKLSAKNHVTVTAKGGTLHCSVGGGPAIVIPSCSLDEVQPTQEMLEDSEWIHSVVRASVCYGAADVLDIEDPEPEYSDHVTVSLGAVQAAAAHLGIKLPPIIPD
jgi:hypothetical protein